MDIQYLSGWIGRTKENQDTITARLVDTYCATLAPHLAKVDNGEAPLALQWCLAPDAVVAAKIGQDGHPLTGEFLPPVPLPRRMWAGGQIETLAPLRVGDSVTRRSKITNVTQKEGRSGVLCFVTVEHEISTDRGVAIRERQDLVYRDAPPSPSAERPAPEAKTAVPVSPPACDLVWTIEASPVLLFRYSALTFNSHRIHYDRPYATGIEAYPGLVVHGPLQSSLLLNLAATIGGTAPRIFSYRGLAPLIAGGDFHVCGQRQADGSLRCWTQSASGETGMECAASW